MNRDDPSPSARPQVTISETAPATKQPTIQPIVAALALGAAITLVPTLLAFLLPTETLANAAAHARPLLALCGCGLLLLTMLVAVISDLIAGKGSLLGVARAIVAIASVALCFLATFEVFWPITGVDLPAFLLVGFAVGLGAAFITGGGANYTDSSLAILAWGAATLVLFVEFFISILTYRSPPGAHPFYGLGALIFSAYLAIIFFSVVTGVTVVRLGGVVGGWLRRGTR